MTLPCYDSPVLQHSRYLCEDQLQDVPICLLAQTLDHETTGTSQGNVVHQRLGSRLVALLRVATATATSSRRHISRVDDERAESELFDHIRYTVQRGKECCAATSRET